MANTIDYSTLAVGALIGVGCRKQLKSAAKIAVNFAANLAGATAAAVSEAAEATQTQQPQPQGQTQQPQAGQGNGN